MSGDLELALALADEADELTLARFRARDLHVETKADATPVTDADRAVERRLREHLAAERPDEAVLGEEEGGAAADGPCWVLDPIDGTRNYSRGIPVWATLIALERDGEAVCGVVSAPALGRRWWAERGDGAYAAGGRLHVSGVADLAAAAVSCSIAGDLARVEPHVWHARGLGDFWQHMLVAEGALDAAVDSPLERWDRAALEPILLEAGGSFGLVNGQFVSSNGLVHDELAQRLSL